MSNEFGIFYLKDGQAISGEMLNLYAVVSIEDGPKHKLIYSPETPEELYKFLHDYNEVRAKHRHAYGLGQTFTSPKRDRYYVASHATFNNMTGTPEEIRAFLIKDNAPTNSDYIRAIHEFCDALANGTEYKYIAQYLGVFVGAPKVVK